MGVMAEWYKPLGICKLGNDVGLCLLVRDWVLVDWVISIGEIYWLDSLLFKIVIAKCELWLMVGFLVILVWIVDYELVLGFDVWFGENRMKSWSDFV
jgi:hypothetical protein